MNSQIDYYNEVDLISYIKLFKKRKKLIITVFLFFLIIAGVYTFFIAPKTYKAEGVLQVGKIETIQGIRTALEDPSQVVQKIKSGIYGDYPGLEATKIEGTYLIVVGLTADSPQKAEELLRNVINNLLTDHENELEDQKKPIADQIEEYDKLVEEINKDISFFINQGQQIGSLRSKIYDYSIVNKDIEIQLKGFQNTSIVKEPIASDRPISPNIIFNMTIGGLLGIFAGLFLAFIAEWWKENKHKVRL